jgi:hypothetical protein
MIIVAGLVVVIVAGVIVEVLETSRGFLADVSIYK